MQALLFILFIFTMPIYSAGCQNIMPTAKIISYYEESPIMYQHFFTLYRDGKVTAKIKQLKAGMYDYRYSSNWEELTFEGTLDKEELNTFFKPINSMEWDKTGKWPSPPRGGESFSLQIVFPDRTEVIESKLDSIKTHKKLSVFHQAITNFFQTRLSATTP